MLYETGSLKDKALYTNLHLKLIVLGKKINNFFNRSNDRIGLPGSEP